jgi:hypothetical protein
LLRCRDSRYGRGDCRRSRTHYTGRVEWTDWRHWRTDVRWVGYAFCASVGRCRPRPHNGLSVRIGTCRGTHLHDCPRVPCWTRQTLRFRSYLACRWVRRAGVLDFEPVGVDGLTVATTGAVCFFLPRLTAGEVCGAGSRVKLC